MENPKHPIENQEWKKREIFLDHSRKELSDVFSKHHIIWKQHKDRANVEFKENHMMVKQKRHDAFNIVFEQDKHQDPQSQLLFILSKTKNVIEYNTYNQLFKILSKPKESFYKDFLVKK